MEEIQKNIVPLIENQFPEFYRSEGPIFVEFVKQYYSWLEGYNVVSNTSFTGTGYVKVNSKSANVIGVGTNFVNSFSNGETIAIYYADSVEVYDLFTINAITNSTFMTLTSNTLPEFTSSNSWYTSTFTQYNPNYYLRRFTDNTDIDLTVEDFIVYFKEKYLKNIQYDTAANIRNLLKHSLNLYRSKGTERSIDLLFRSVFGVPASVYYPGNDLFKLSDGKWYTPIYLEISMKKDSEKLVGKQIVGDSSGATAFAEALVRRSVQGRLIDVLYISAVKGDFQTDEYINSSDMIIDQSERPYIIGSLTTLDVNVEGSGQGYAIGDLVTLYSDYGEQGKGRVTGTTNATGRVTFTLENGGYAYRETSNVLVSEDVLILGNLQFTTYPDRYADFLEGIILPTATITYYDVSETFIVAANDYLYTYYVNNDLKGIGLVVGYTKTTNTEGSVTINILYGNTDDATYYTQSNTLSATQNTYNIETYQANIIGYHSNVTITATNVSGTFTAGEELYQVDEYGLFVSNGTINYIGDVSTSVKFIRVSNAKGVFTPEYPLKGRLSGANGTVNTQSIQVGVINSTNTLYATPNNYVYLANSGATATINSIGAGSLANVSFSNSLLYTETIDINDDYLRDYAILALNASTYGFPDFPSGNLTNGTLQQMLANTTYTIGKIQQLTGINTGQDYNIPPIVKVWDDLTAGYAKRDYVLEISNVSGVFQVGEIVSQIDPSSRGLVTSANSTHMFVEQLRIKDENNFAVTIDANTVLTGELSGTTANVDNFYVDYTSEFLGLNAVIDASVKTLSGSVTKLEVYNSGFGYKKDDQIRFVKVGEPWGSEDAGLAFATLSKQGYGEGYYKKKGGWLSSSKKLFDGIYYQEYSYEVRSSLTLNKYEEMLKQILHVAGTKYFGALLYSTVSNSTITSQSTVITQE